MSDSRSVLFGDMQYQISKPTKGPDGYNYQRVRHVGRDGSLVGDGEFVVRSTQKGSEDGLFDLNGGRQAGYAAARSAFDLGRVGLGAAFENPFLLRGGAADIAKGAITGFPLPAPFRAEYDSWPGTAEPWDEKTLNSDSRPSWQPGYLERMLFGDPNTRDAGDSSATTTPTPAFRPDAAYSPDGSFIGNFGGDGR